MVIVRVIDELLSAVGYQQLRLGVLKVFCDFRLCRVGPLTHLPHPVVQLHLETANVGTVATFVTRSCLSLYKGSFGHTVKKYNSFGDLVQVLGTPGQRGAGLNPLQFDNPAELYVEDTGDIYVVDGDGGLNNRLVKLSQGTWLNFKWCYVGTSCKKLGLICLILDTKL